MATNATSTSSIQETVVGILADELSLDADQITLDSSLDELGADSLKLIEIEMRLGESFNIPAVLNPEGEITPRRIIATIEAALNVASAGDRLAWLNRLRSVEAVIVGIVAKSRGLSNRVVRPEFVLGADLGADDVVGAKIVVDLEMEFEADLGVKSVRHFTVQQVIDLVRLKLANK